MLQNTLGQLRLANIATLDAITTHFTRLIELTSAEEPFISALAQALAPCILRPRTDNSLTMHERHSYRLIRDLFAHKEAIFGELKRASALSHSNSGGTSAPRLRAISTDESNRRANTEARNRAIASRSRANSPAPHANGGRSHRRDRSTGPAETRFPIQTSSPPGTADAPRRGRGAVRSSLEVPDGKAAQATDRGSSAAAADYRDPSSEPPATQTPESASVQEHGGFVEHGALQETANGAGPQKTGSLGRGSRFAQTKMAAKGPNRDSVGSGGSGGGKKTSLEEDRPVGVQLTDKPMDD